ncbi:MAG: secreted lipase [Linnemannia gamsii]|nr:MAG: secreted lipase [Linnemannia gamsii]
MKFSFPSILSASTAALLLALSSSPLVHAGALPLDTGLLKAAAPLGTAETLAKRALVGVNNYDCKLTPQHPRPLLLVHGTLNTLEMWALFAPILIKEGYCVFALTYGRYQQSIIGGLAPIEESAKELAIFADNVLEKMGVKQLDYVGYSQGGILGRYWIKYLGGAGKVNRMIGISPIYHGTSLSNIVNMAKVMKIFAPGQHFTDLTTPSFYNMVEGSPFMKKLNKGGDTSPDVIHFNIASQSDEVVTPYRNCFQSAPATNEVVQNLCKSTLLVGHLRMPNHPTVWQFVLNKLDPANARTESCFARVEWLGF